MKKQTGDLNRPFPKEMYSGARVSTLERDEPLLVKQKTCFKVTSTAIHEGHASQKHNDTATHPLASKDGEGSPEAEQLRHPTLARSLEGYSRPGKGLTALYHARKAFLSSQLTVRTGSCPSRSRQAGWRTVGEVF